MQDVPQRTIVYRFGVFEADLASGELLKQGVKVRLQSQPFQILVLLLEKRGEVVTRDEIRRKLWPPDTFVDFEQGLGTAIKKLRRALGDDAEEPCYIETLPKRGYRFIADVNKDALPTPPTANLRSSRRWRMAAIAIVSLLAVASGALWLILRLENRDTLVPAVPLTSYPGVELSPSFSPDGAQVAFSWDGDQLNNFDIYVKTIGSGPPLRLTNDPAEDKNPIWSPDGGSIVFHRVLANDRAALIEIPPLGGPERFVTEVSIPPSSPFEPFSSWYPDNKWLATTDLVENSKGGSNVYAIFLISSETGERRQLTQPPAGLIGDSSPAFSPNGKSLAFVRSVGHGVSELLVAPISPQLAPGEPRRLVSQNKSIVRPVWTADGSRIIYGVEVTAGSLWQISASGGKPEPLRFGGEIGQTQTPAVSLRGNRLAYSRRVFDTNIWRTSIAQAGNTRSAPAPLITSTRLEWDARFSPDGNRIAFATDRSGAPEIWISDATGSNPRQLTAFHGAGLGSPRWSPDGSMLVFDSGAAGQWDIYTIPAGGGKLTLITTSPSNEHVPSWSGDGKYIYFASNRTGQFQVWKAPTPGGSPVQVTKNGGYSAFESADGRTIYYSKQSWGDHISLWRMPAGGGQERLIVKLVHMRNFDVAYHGLYFVTGAARPPFALRFLDFGTESVTDLFTLPQQLYSTISVSPDEKWLIYATVDQDGSDLMLVEDFH